MKKTRSLALIINERGIEETKGFILMLVKIANAIAAFKKSEPFKTIGDLIQSIGFVQNGIDGSDEIPSELGDLSDAEISEIKDSIRKELKIPNATEVTNEVVAEMLNCGMSVYKMIHIIHELRSHGRLAA